MEPGESQGRCSSTCQATKDCPSGYKRCSSSADGEKACFPGCEGPQDCPNTRPRCVEEKGRKTCQETPYTGPEACGRGNGNAVGVGKPCPNGAGDCGAGGLCLGAKVAPLQPFCSKGCTKDADCGQKAVCRWIEEGGSRKQACLPKDCLCLEAPALQGKVDLLGQALQKVGRSRCSLIYEKRELNTINSRVAHDPFRLAFFNRIHREPLQTLAFGKEVAASLDQALQRNGLEAVAKALERGAFWLDAPVSGKATTHSPATTEPLASSVAKLIREHGGTPDITALQKEAAQVPLALQKKLAPIVLAISAAATLRNQAIPSSYQASYLFARAHSLVLPAYQRFALGSNGVPAKDYHLLARDFGYAKLYEGAWQLAKTIASVGLKADSSYKGFSFNVVTPLGRIVLSDNAAHKYAPSDPQYQGAIALLVDTGGDDEYQIQAGANASANNPVSVLLDLAGADKYGYVEKAHALDRGKRFPSDADGRYQPKGFCDSSADCGLLGGPCVFAACQKGCKTDKDCGSGDTCVKQSYCKKVKQSPGPFSLSNRPRQGGGRLGIAFLFDLGIEKDEYRSLRMSQGFGALGVGVLYDAGGDDSYQCEAGCQGSGAFGMGLLLDRSGNDTYRTYSYAQGFGYTRGVGMLLDQEGDDKYLADHGDRNQAFFDQAKGDPLYLSAQLPGQANNSFVQGAGFGRRADFSDFLFMSGGLGILRDAKGDDVYISGVFGQGTGFWYGTGILADAQGHDRYDGFWYVQGAAAHFALAIFLEGAGNDKYNTQLTPRATHTGTGHDFSTAWLVDDGGNDTYNAANLTLGAGNDNGYGFLVDNGGDDTYTSKGNHSLGIARSPNPDNNPRNASKIRTLGLFLDVGGKDRYIRPDTTKPGDNKAWLQGRSQDNTPRRSLEHGVGTDGNGTSTLSTR